MATKTTQTRGRVARPPTKVAAPTASAPISLFLTNLRLLNLDLLPDWPDLTQATFASTSAGAQGHKKRLQCVEWSLYRLFELWDPEETAAVTYSRFCFRR